MFQSIPAPMVLIFSIFLISLETGCCFAGVDLKRALFCFCFPFYPLLVAYSVTQVINNKPVCSHAFCWQYLALLCLMSNKLSTKLEAQELFYASAVTLL